jgi:hypothetical protein
MKTRLDHSHWFQRLLTAAFVWLVIQGNCQAQTAPGPEGLSAEEWQLVLDHRAKKAQSATKARKSATSVEVVRLGSNALSQKKEPLMVPLSFEPLAALASAQPRSGRVVIVHRNSLGYDFLPGQMQDEPVAGDLYNNSYPFFRGLLSGLRLRSDLEGLKPVYALLDKGLNQRTGAPRAANGLGAMETATSQEEDLAAEIGYVRDGLTDSEVWTAKGVLYLPLSYINAAGDPLSLLPDVLGYENTWTIFYPAIRFNRDSSKDGTAGEINQLDFMIGADFNYYPAPGKLNESIREILENPLGQLGGVFRVAAGVRTNFDFESAEPITEWSFQPVKKEAGLNSYLDAGDRKTMAFRPRMILKALAQATQADIDPEDLNLSKEAIMPLGFEAGFSFKPEMLGDTWGKMELSAVYRCVYDVLNDNAFHGLFTAKLQLPMVIGQSTEAGWVLSYERGDDLDTYEEIDELKLGLSVRF